MVAKKEKPEDSLITEVLEEAFPGETSNEKASFGLVLAGVRWGQDYRFGLLPENETGAAMRALECSGEKYHGYLSWLADYLYALEAEPIEEQKGLCKYLSNMQAENAVMLVGMNAALYEFEVEDMEDAIEAGKPFSLFLKEEREWAREMDLEEEGYDEDTLREMFQTVEMEMETKQKYRSDISFADTGYRLALSVVLKKIEKHDERIELLNFFYQAYNNYAAK